MEVRSEKVFYENDVLDAFRNKDVDLILWGEDLYDAKIVVYPKKIKAAPGYSDFSYRLIDAGLVYFNYRQKDFIKSKVVRWDPEKRIMYIPEAEFNNFWKFLKGSINLGIKIYGGNEDFPITRAEDIVDLSMLKKPGSEGIIEKN